VRPDGLAAVTADLTARRGRRFQRVRQLVNANPEANVRRSLIDAIVQPDAEETAGDAG
jgi:hypothetical protein